MARYASHGTTELTGTASHDIAGDIVIPSRPSGRVPLRVSSAIASRGYMDAVIIAQLT